MRDELGRFIKGHQVLDTWKEKSREIHRGLALHTTHHTDVSRSKMSLSHKGIQAKENNPNWKGGISTIRSKYRGSTEYKQWRTAVFKRDNFTCQKCGETKEYLHAHHIEPFAEKMNNYSVENGLTVCYKCHEKIHGFELGKGSYSK